MPSFCFNTLGDGIAKGTIVWTSDTIHCILLKGNGTPLKTNATVGDALGEANVDECDATNYVRKTLANKAVTTTGNKTLFDADNPVWTALGGASNNTITGVLIFKFVTNDAASIPLAYIDVADLVTNGGQVTYTKDATNKMFYLDNT